MRLKNLISICENNLLHSLNYNVGPVVIPFSLVNGFCNRFVIEVESIANNDQVELLHKKFKPIVNLIVLDCCKTSMYIDFTGKELVLACILKTLAIFNIPNLDVTPDDKNLEIWNQAIARFVNTCNRTANTPIDGEIICKRLSLALMQMRYFKQISI